MIKSLKKKCIMIAMIFIFVLSGCQGKEVLATWKYTTPEQIYDMTVTKSVYSVGKLTIYAAGSDNKRISRIECFDGDCQLINSAWKWSADRSKIVIEGNRAEEISGVTLYLGSVEEVYKIRYLDSDRCCMLYGQFICDIGMEYSGDEERFKSDGERQAEIKLEEKEDELRNRAYEFMEGRWIAEGGSGQEILAYTDEAGYRMVAVADEEYIIDVLQPVQRIEGYIEIILSGDGWNTLYDTLYLDMEDDTISHDVDVFHRAAEE